MGEDFVRSAAERQRPVTEFPEVFFERVFADGSVRQFTVKLGNNLTAQKHDALRKHFLIKWPSGMPRGEGI